MNDVFLPPTGFIILPQSGLLVQVDFEGKEYIFDPPVEVTAGEPLNITQNEDGTWSRID